MNAFSLRLLSLALALASAGCKDLGPTEQSSFERLQSQVFEPSCVACHTAGTTDAARSGLVLDRAVAWSQLVGARPTIRDAREDGLLRVKPSDPEASLLLRKLSWPYVHELRDYGSPMPLGGAPLSQGQLEFVRRWILAGAPERGEVADPALLADRTPQTLAPFEPLAPPAQGFQLRIERFAVAPNFERELFVHRRVGNGADVFVNRMQTSMRPGSHHFLLYAFPPGTPASVIPALDVVRDIRRPDGSLDLLAMVPMAYHLFVGGAMTSQGDWRFPEGVALRLKAGATLDLNSHYVNRTAAESAGEVQVNLHTIDAARVRHEAFSLNLSNTNITLPPRTRTTLTRTFTMPQRVTVFLLTSHMHQLGERFVIRIAGGPRNGQIVYQTDSWSHPDVVTFETPLVLEAGEGLRSEITYHNTTDRTVRFGLTSEDEMGIVFGYYYCATPCGAALTELMRGESHLHGP